MTPLVRDPGSPTRPEGHSDFAPRTCRLLAAFTAAPAERGTRICRHASSGRSILGECDGWGASLVALHVLGHESVHLAGVVDEAAADCLAMQLDALVAMQLGASPAFARTLARDYWAQYYPAQEPEYRSPQCRDGGSLDLFRVDGVADTAALSHRDRLGARAVHGSVGRSLSGRRSRGVGASSPVRVSVPASGGVDTWRAVQPLLRKGQER